MALQFSKNRESDAGFRIKKILAISVSKSYILAWASEIASAAFMWLCALTVWYVTKNTTMFKGEYAPDIWNKFNAPQLWLLIPVAIIAPFIVAGIFNFITEKLHDRIIDDHKKTIVRLGLNWVVLWFISRFVSVLIIICFHLTILLMSSESQFSLYAKELVNSVWFPFLIFTILSLFTTFAVGKLLGYDLADQYDEIDARLIEEDEDDEVPDSGTT